MTSKAPSGINVFVHEKRGNVAVLFALMMIPVVGAIGAAVDYARMLRLKTQLQAVADAATMAGLKTYRETGDAEEGRQRLLAFIDEGLEKDGMTRAREADEEGADLMGGTRRQGRIVVVSDAVINTENSTVKPVLATTIETPFMSFLGVEQLPVEVYTGGAVAASSITGTKAIEVSVMLDVSGSMGGDKIDDMKLAAGDFIDIILPDGVEVDNRRIGLVPFSQYVNAGSYASAATGLAPTLQVQTGTQTTGVVFSATEFDWLSLNQCRNRVRDTTAFGNYSGNDARQYCISNFESRRYFGWIQYRTPELVEESVPVYATRNLRTCVTERQGFNAYNDVAVGPNSYVGPMNPNSGTESQYSSSGGCSIPVIKTLSTDKVDLKAHVSSLTAGGLTAGHVGTAWAYYMLSPVWNSFWNYEEPLANYGDTETIKAAVLMTDGEYNSSVTSTTASNQAKAICQKMKDDGITVYTIGFDMSTNVNDPTRQTLVECASPGQYYFPYDGDQLREAFQQIGNSLVAISTRTSDGSHVIIQE